MRVYILLIFILLYYILMDVVLIVFTVKYLFQNHTHSLRGLKALFDPKVCYSTVILNKN